ncbi:hypothetical protein GCM10009785_27410 [Brooklawnia cerclae]
MVGTNRLTITAAAAMTAHASRPFTREDGVGVSAAIARSRAGMDFTPATVADPWVVHQIEVDMPAISYRYGLA